MDLLASSGEDFFLRAWLVFSLSDDLESDLLWDRLTSASGLDLVCGEDRASRPGDLAPALLPWVGLDLDEAEELDLGSGGRADNRDVLGGLDPDGLSGEDSDLDSSSDEDCELALDLDFLPLGGRSGEDSERSLRGGLPPGTRSADSLGLAVGGRRLLAPPSKDDAGLFLSGGLLLGWRSEEDSDLVDCTLFLGCLSEEDSELDEERLLLLGCLPGEDSELALDCGDRNALPLSEDCGAPGLELLFNGISGAETLGRS